MTNQQTITIDNKQYNFDDFNDNARAQLENLRFVDEQLQLLVNRAALIQTAKAAYTRVLADSLPEKKAAANKKKNTILIDKEKYNLDDFNEQGKSQLLNIQFSEQELALLNDQQAVMQTARSQYLRALTEEVKQLTPVKPQ